MSIHSNVGDIAQVVAAAGTAVALSSTQLLVRGLVLQAKKVGGTNTGNVYVGISTVDSTTRQMIVLSNSSAPWTVPIPAGAAIDLRDIYIDATTNADGVVGLYFT